MTRTLQCVILWLFLCLGFSVAAPAQERPGEPPVSSPTYRVRVVRNVRIPMRDGVSLSADLIRPDSEGQFPVIVEYHPYRKDDVTRAGLSWHHYFAERGFVGVRLDVRGTGSSEGINTDEFGPYEQSDGYDAVEWLAQQPWSNGKVGMFGASYGGFTALQVAMNQPPHLRAVVSVYASDDRYADDSHFRGGNMRMYYDVGTWGTWMLAMNSLPPSPELVGPRWAETWQQRLDRLVPYVLQYFKNQVDGPYWRNASLRPGYDRIRCPVYLMAGWHDGYANPMLRLYTQLQCPKKLLVGPWVHTWPDRSTPGPRIDHFHEALRFFANWLRDENTSIMQEPPVTLYMQEYAEPHRTLEVIPGHWRNDAEFPVPGTKEMTFYLNEDGRLATATSPSVRQAYDEYAHIATAGTRNGYWSAGFMTTYLPEDQRGDEAYSAVYTTSPFQQEERILGWPQVILHVSSSAQAAAFVAKLADVAPDGHSALIADGSLNGTRRASFTGPAPMNPEEIYQLSIPMRPTGWVIKPGHRLRLAISSSDFPNLWPTPEKGSNRVYLGSAYPSRVILPVVPESQLQPVRFLPPPALPEIVRTLGEPSKQQVLYDQITGTVSVLWSAKSTTLLDDNLGSLHQDQSFRCSASSRNPAQASIVGLHKLALEREDGTVEVTAEGSVRATETDFHILINLNVMRNGRPFFHKQWIASEPRRLL